MNKWDLRFLKSDEVFDTAPFAFRVLDGYIRYLDFGDGLLVATKQLEGTLASFRFALWARSMEHFGAHP
jgi:hypothetical protein